MRRRDKLKNIEKANLLTEQRHLESKSLLTEALTTDLEQFAKQTLKPKLEGAGFQVALFGDDKKKMVVDKVDENPKLIGIIWNPSNLKPYGSKNSISIHMNGEATSKVNSILSNFNFAKESGEAKQGKGWDSDTTHKASATYNEGDLVLIDGNNVRTKVIFQAGNPEKLGLREAVAYKNASDNELAQYIVNLSNELTAAKSHGDEKEIGYIMKDLAEVKAELESRKKTKMNEERNPYSGFLSTDDTKTVIVRSNEDWEKLATSLGSKGFKHQGSLNPLNPNKGLTQMSNYAKFPYEVEINKTQKLVDFGEHTLDK
tara:strand:- start:7656 stop:8600 length:945 start_codon:yes stop_codon:yes gene_type:complete